MGDVYVYRFLPFSVGGASVSRSPRAGTLVAIEKLGTPVMESQIVVDGSEVDGEGFLVLGVGFGSSAITRLSREMKSLELRAASRDLQALSMNSTADGAAIYMLSLESRHLRRQVQRLAVERAEVLADESGHISVSMAFPPLSSIS